MEWLFHNPIADMPGPSFLVFYAFFAAIVVAAAFFYLQVGDPTKGLAPPQTPREIDPYELAYLRGGVNEVIRTAIYALHRKRAVEVTADGLVRTTGGGFKVYDLSPIERRVFESAIAAPKVAALFKSRELLSKLESLCEAYRRRLSSQQLLMSPEVRRAGVWALAFGLALLVALAGYKIGMAIHRGRSNVGFLCVETVAAGAVLYWIFLKNAAGPASARGKAFVKQVQRVYSGNLAAAFGGEGAGAAAGGAALLMVGLFGFSILKGTPDAALARQFSASQGGADGGGGCGGGGGGGGCGGCGGGD